jgi:hypothetical protein
MSLFELGLEGALQALTPHRTEAQQITAKPVFV